MTAARHRGGNEVQSDGFGNLIALPLQKRPRERGNSVFLDDDLQPHADQWEFLATIRPIERTAVDAVVADAERKGNIVGVRLAVTDNDDAPWTAPPLPSGPHSGAKRPRGRPGCFPHGDPPDRFRISES